MEEERYIRLKDGDIYGYTEILARRKDAVIVDAYAAAQGFRAMGVSNELTARFPYTATLDNDQRHERPSGFQSIYQKQREDQVERKRAMDAKRADRAERLRRMQEAETTEPVKDLLGDVTDGS